jgi:hypothetical protein
MGQISGLLPNSTLGHFILLVKREMQGWEWGLKVAGGEQRRQMFGKLEDFGSLGFCGFTTKKSGSE